MEEIKQQQTPVNLYLMVPHLTLKRGREVTKICLLSCKKIKAFAGVAPTREILATHFQAEWVKVQISKKQSEENTYVPQPLCLEVKSSIFASIVEEARAKDSKLGNLSVLSLTLGNFIPCCLITASKEESEDETPESRQVCKKENQEIE